MGEKLSTEDVAKLVKAVETITTSFVWVDSRRGWAYWDDVCGELQRIAETGEP